jgi:hypothetical protein
MVDYLALERGVSRLGESEKSERSEKTLEQGHVAIAAEHGEKAPVVALVWHQVDRSLVAASAPPPEWNGTLPANCGWPTLCHVLGPCPVMQTRDGCPFAGPLRLSGLARHDDVAS